MKRKRSLEELSTSNYLSSPEATSHEFDVFLSFRGPDTRKKFTSHLHQRLICNGLSVFKDDVKMVRGEGINEALKTAINKSRICIPIFSKNYASSKACLQELSHMVLNCKSIIPVFYDVGADDVKLKTDLYKKALEDHHHKGKVGKEEIQKWENALLEVGRILGYNIVKKDEAKVITKITREVLKRSEPKYQNVSNHFVKIDDEVETVIKMLDLNSDGCCIIGLCGMGGIGKTTLAKAVFNHLSANFDNCCTFIANIRESVLNNELPKLQQQLYEDLIDPRSAGSIDNINSGINMIKKGLKNKRFLLVLDDMGNGNQLTNFVGDHSRLANGSRIIITTRDKRVLDALKKDSIQQSNGDQALLKVYQVQQLDDDRALQLFSKCAFIRDSPPDEFKSLSEKVVSSLGGLPLALEVFGSSLFGRSKKAWEETMERLMKTPDKTIQTSLMTSYCELHICEQNIFLDIACYPGNLEKTGAYYMWKSCGWQPDLSLGNLIDKSLVKVEKDNGLWMHDVLKDLGRDIVQEKCKRNGRKFQKFLQISGNVGRIPNEERKYVEMLHIVSYFGTITSNDLIGFENVRFLKLNADKIEGNFEGIFPNLRWITIDYVELSKATNFNPENLVVLQLKHSHIKVPKLWWSQLKAHKLQVLEIISDSSMEWTSGYKEFSSLEVLNLHGCSNLVNSIGDLKRLIRINIGGYNYLASLPQTISGAKDLEEIVLMGGFQRFKLPALVCNLENLSRLCLTCVEMEELEDSIGNLVSLCELDLSHTSIKVLPNAIGQLKQLKILRINGCQIRKFPPTIGNLMKLEELEAVECENFEGDIPSEIGMLSSLRIFDFSRTPICRMQKLPSSLTHLLVESPTTNIEICSSSLLELINVIKVELSCSSRCDDNYFNVPSDQVDPRRLDFRWIWRSSMLEKLSLRIPYVISGLESVNELSWLEELDLSFAEFQDHLQLPSTLSSLRLYDCKFRSGTLDVSNAKKKLRRLYIVGCNICEIRGLTEMDSLEDLSIGRLTNLSSLKLWSCRKIKAICGYDGLESLTDVSIRHCPSLVNLTAFSQIRSLSSIELWNCKKLVELDMFSGLDYLTHLSIKDLGINSLNLVACGKLESIEGLDGLESLTELFIKECPSLRSLPDLSMSGKLQSLRLCRLERLECINGVGCLTYLHIEDCPSLRSLPDLSTLGNLQSLRLCRLERLECINGVGCLIYLHIEGLPSLRSLPDLSTLGNLQSLRLCRLERLECINGVGSFTELFIEDCPSLRSLPDLSMSGKLQSLRPCRLERLECINGVGCLTYLHIEDCPSLRSLPDLSTLGNLQSLRLCRLERLECINGVGCLIYIHIEDCPSLRSLPDLSMSGKLQSLRLCRLERLECINGVGSFTELFIEDCPSLRSLPDLSMSGKLQSLRLCRLERLECINGVGSFTELFIEDCPSLRSLPDLSMSGKLQSLRLCRLERLECINGVGSFTKLFIEDCPSLRSLPDLSMSGKLQSLRLCRLERLECINGVGCLTYLHIEDCPSLRSLPDLSTLGNLQSLRLCRLERLECINGVGCLTYLHIEDCPSLRSLPDLSTLGNLQSLRLCRLERLECINGVGCLIYLHIEGLPSLRSLPDLSTLGNLQSLRLCRLERLECINGVGSFTELFIEDCPSLRTLPDLSTSGNLQFLRLCNLERLECINGVGSLTKLCIEDCPSLRSLPDLSTSGNLQSLRLRRLERLECIEGLTQLEFLEEVNIAECHSLELDPIDLSKLKNKYLCIKNCDKLPGIYFDDLLF